MGGPYGATSPARANPCGIFLQGRLWPIKLRSRRKIEFFHTIGTPAVHYTVIRLSESVIEVPRSRPERTDSNSDPHGSCRGQPAATRESKWMVLVFHCS
jgi:hypothetical protein